MTMSPRAREAHQRLFGTDTPALAATDPDFTSFVANFALDEVPSHGSVEERLRWICICGCLAAQHTIPGLRQACRAALASGVSPSELKEVAYHVAAYCGLGRSLDAVQCVNEALTEAGVELPLPEQSTTTPETRYQAGLEVQYEMIGREAVDARVAAAPPETAHIQTWLLDNCFGDNYTRGGLDLATRELLTFVLIISLGGAEPQATAHAGINLRMGVSRERLIEVVSQLVPYLGYPRTLNALACIDKAAG